MISLDCFLYLTINPIDSNRANAASLHPLFGMISKLLSSNGVIIDEISVQGENLETYFENLIGGRKNV